MLALAIMIEFNGSYEKLPLLEEWMAKERTASEDLISELTEALREARRLICSGEQSDAVYHVHVARAAAIIDAALAKAGGQINE